MEISKTQLGRYSTFELKNLRTNCKNFERLQNVTTYFLLTSLFASLFDRVATAQGIWLLTFPDRENTGNLVNLIFYTGKIVATQGKF